jgi:hypothetical protein
MMKRARERLRKNDSFNMIQPMSKKRRIDNGDEVDFGFIGAVISDPKEPKSFDQAWNFERERNDWRNAIRKELISMETKNVWNVVGLDALPKGRKIIGCKWVFKKKRNSVQMTRLVALGYSQGMMPNSDWC